VSGHELWNQRRGTILVALLAVAAAVLGFYLVTKDDSGDGSAAPTSASSAASSVSAEQKGAEPDESHGAGDRSAGGDSGRRDQGTGGKGSEHPGGGREDLATVGQSSGGPAPRAGQPLQSQPGGESEPVETEAPEQPPQSANGAADSSESTEPVGSGGQPPSENPDAHGQPTQLPPDEPDRPGDGKPSVDHGDPNADGSNELPGE
jgi:hypothetical protein